MKLKLNHTAFITFLISLVFIALPSSAQAGWQGSFYSGSGGYSNYSGSSSLGSISSSLDNTNPCVHTGTCPQSTCFVKGTLITMADGAKKPIEDVQVGDQVLSFDSNRQLTPYTVQELDAPIREGYYDVALADETIIKVTNEHPLYAASHHHSSNSSWEGWASIDPDFTYQYEQLKVKKYQVGDYLLRQDNSWQQITNITYHPGDIQTYNLKSVQGAASFFAEGYWAHNKDHDYRLRARVICQDYDGPVYPMQGVYVEMDGRGGNGVLITDSDGYTQPEISGSRGGGSTANYAFSRAKEPTHAILAYTLANGTDYNDVYLDHTASYSCDRDCSRHWFKDWAKFHSCRDGSNTNDDQFNNAIRCDYHDEPVIKYRSCTPAKQCGSTAPQNLCQNNAECGTDNNCVFELPMVADGKTKTKAMLNKWFMLRLPYDSKRDLYDPSSNEYDPSKDPSYYLNVQGFGLSKIHHGLALDMDAFDHRRQKHISHDTSYWFKFELASQQDGLVNYKTDPLTLLDDSSQLRNFWDEDITGYTQVYDINPYRNRLIYITKDLYWSYDVRSFHWTKYKIRDWIELFEQYGSWNKFNPNLGDPTNKAEGMVKIDGQYPWEGEGVTAFDWIREYSTNWDFNWVDTPRQDIITIFSKDKVWRFNGKTNHWGFQGTVKNFFIDLDTRYSNNGFKSPPPVNGEYPWSTSEGITGYQQLYINEPRLGLDDANYFANIMYFVSKNKIWVYDWKTDPSTNKQKGWIYTGDIYGYNQYLENAWSGWAGTSTTMKNVAGQTLWQAAQSAKGITAFHRVHDRYERKHDGYKETDIHRYISGKNIWSFNRIVNQANKWDVTWTGTSKDIANKVTTEPYLAIKSRKKIAGPYGNKNWYFPYLRARSLSGDIANGYQFKCGGHRKRINKYYKWSVCHELFYGDTNSRDYSMKIEWDDPANNNWMRIKNIAHGTYLTHLVPETGHDKNNSYSRAVDGYIDFVSRSNTPEWGSAWPTWGATVTKKEWNQFEVVPLTGTCAIQGSDLPACQTNPNVQNCCGPQPPNANFTIHADQPGGIGCTTNNTNTVHLENNSTTSSSQNIDKYQWDFDNDGTTDFTTSNSSGSWTTDNSSLDPTKYTVTTSGPFILDSTKTCTPENPCLTLHKRQDSNITLKAFVGTVSGSDSKPVKIYNPEPVVINQPASTINVTPVKLGWTNNTNAFSYSSSNNKFIVTLHHKNLTNNTYQPKYYIKDASSYQISTTAQSSVLINSTTSDVEIPIDSISSVGNKLQVTTVDATDIWTDYSCSTSTSTTDFIFTWPAWWQVANGNIYMHGNYITSTINHLSGSSIDFITGEGTLYYNGSFLTENFNNDGQFGTNAKKINSAYSGDLTSTNYSYDFGYWSDKLSGDYTKINSINEISFTDSSKPRIYFLSGSYSIGDKNITQPTIVLVKGSLNITDDIKIASTGTVLFIVKDDININPEVKNLSGVYLSKKFTSRGIPSTTSFDQQLIIDGSIISWGEDNIELNRDLGFRDTLGDMDNSDGISNLDSPAETFNYNPTYIYRLINTFEEIVHFDTLMREVQN